MEDHSTKIRNLLPNLFVIVTGIILYRSPSKCPKSLNILLRDSKDNSILCVIWGTPFYLQQLWNKCEYGKIVTIYNGRVSQAIFDYHPTTTSPFIITASDGSQVEVKNFNHSSPFHGLLGLPLKPIEMALNLEDIRINGEKGIGQSVDVCVLVRQVKPTKEIKMKDGTAKHLRECVLCDRSNAGLLMTMWSDDFIARSEHWQPLIQVLHIIDAKLGYSSFYKSMVLATTSKTVILENPEHTLAKDLVDYGLQINPFDSTVGGARGGDFLPSAEEITEVMTCQRLVDRIQSKGDEDQFSGVIYGVVTKFDIDGDERGIKRKW